MGKYIFDLIDTISPILTIIFGVYGAYNDTKPVNGTLSREGKIAVRGIIITGLLTVIIKSGTLYEKAIDQEQQITDLTQKKKEDDKFKQTAANSFQHSIGRLESLHGLTLTSLTKLQGVAKTQQETYQSTKDNLLLSNSNLNATKGVTYQIMRANYPLEPISITYIKEISMDDPVYKRYIHRIEPYILSSYEDNSYRKAKTLSEISGSHLLGGDPNINVSPADNEAYEGLHYDLTDFSFTKKIMGHDYVITFNCRTLPVTGVGRAYPSKGPTEQRIECVADFKKK